MKKITYIPVTLYKLYFFLVFLITFLPLYPIYYFWLTDEKHFDKGFWLSRWHAKTVLFFTFIRYEINYEAPIDKNKVYVITPNHQSYLDILMLYVIIPQRFVFMAKKELGNIPLFNIFFKKFSILVNRSNPIEAKQALDVAAKKIDAGDSVVIFPEGTIPIDTPKMRRFKSGAFKLAIDKKVPVLPIVFLDNYKLMEDKGVWQSFARPGNAHVIVLPEIDTTNLTEQDLVPLRNEVYNKINQHLKKQL
jgi:1-acyl-sn-glycerol-3-phosphate acyltransferase